MSGEPARVPAGPPVTLCADDFAISAAVSATSAMVTFAEWPQLARRLAALRKTIAVGLHINLTVGAPLGPMRTLAPGGAFPAVGALTLKAGRGGIDTAEVAAEVSRQLEAFQQCTGFVPDFADGHQHVHALPGIRGGVLAALRLHAEHQGRPLLVRDPSDRVTRILQRGASIPKALQVSALAAGFGRAVRAAGLAANDGFSGFSDFDTAKPYARELEAGFVAPGPRQLMMCHPGHVDAALEARDGVTLRREQEYRALMTAEGLRERLWRPGTQAR